MQIIINKFLCKSLPSLHKLLLGYSELYFLFLEKQLQDLCDNKLATLNLRLSAGAQSSALAAGPAAATLRKAYSHNNFNSESKSFHIRTKLCSCLFSTPTHLREIHRNILHWPRNMPN